jgi:ABC-type glycerol-3-phosphate transport system permease component
MKHNKFGERTFRISVHLLLAVCGFYYMYPFLWMLSGSLKTKEEFFGRGLSLIPQQLVWKNYAEAWQGTHFSVYFKNSIFVSVVTTLIIIMLTSMAGYSLARYQFPGKRFILGAILLTMFLPRGFTIIPIFALIMRLGLLNTLWAVILVNAAKSMVFNTFLFAAYFTTLPKELEDAAQIDGANFPIIYLRIAMPLALPMIGTVALFEFIDNWNSFFIPLVFTLGRPDLRTVPVGMYAFVGQNSIEWTLLAAAATMSLLPTLILFFLLQHLFVKGMVGVIRG